MVTAIGGKSAHVLRLKNSSLVPGWGQSKDAQHEIPCESVALPSRMAISKKKLYLLTIIMLCGRKQNHSRNGSLFQLYITPLS